VSESHNVSVIFHTAICSLLSVVGGSSTAVGLPLELYIQKAETMRGLLILCIMMHSRRSRSRSPSTEHDRSMPCHLGLWVGSPASSR
jgi:hypothetical protein